VIGAGQPQGFSHHYVAQAVRQHINIARIIQIELI
jgi:hypothetical protein